MESYETKVDQNKIQSTFKDKYILYILTEQIKMAGEIGRGLPTH